MSDGPSFAGGQLTALGGGGGGGGGITAVNGTEPVRAQTAGTVVALDFFFTGQTRGDLPMRGAAAWQRLAPGAAGTVLTSAGAGADLVWAAAGVPTTRQLATTAPLRIDGGASADLSANRTLSLNTTANFNVVGTNLAINPATAITLDDSVAFRGPTVTLAFENGGVATFGDPTSDAEVLSSGLFGVTIGGAVSSLFDNRGLRVVPGGAFTTALPVNGGVMLGTAGGLYTEQGATARPMLVASSTLLSLGDSSVQTALSSGWIERRTATAVSYAVLTSDHYIAVTNTAAARVITLPNPTLIPVGQEFIVVDESLNAGNSNLTVVATGGAQIGNQTTFRIYDSGAGIRVVNTGTAYRLTAIYPGISTAGQGLTVTGDGSFQWQNTGIDFSTWKPSARAVSIANVASLSGTTTIDGVSLVAGDIVLKALEAPIKQIAAAVGFRNEKSFARAFAGWTGVAPSAWREGVRR